MAELIQERYKIEYKLKESRDYEAYRAVDIEDREKKVYILNVYSGENVKKYVKLFHDLKNCPEYKGEFVIGSKLAAVFEYKTGEELNNIFKKKAMLSQDYRFKSVEQILNIGLIAESFPELLKKSMVEYRNFQVKQTSERIDMNFMIDPNSYSDDYLDVLTDAIRRMLPKSFSEPIEERRFFLSLKRKPVKDGIELYSRWKKAFPAIRKEYDQQISLGIIERVFSLIAKNFKWFIESRFFSKEKK